MVGSASGIRLLAKEGAGKILPLVSLLISLVLLPFIGVLLVASVPIAVLGFVYGVWRKK